MTRLANLVHRDEFPGVRKDFEASHPAQVAKKFRPAYPGVSADALKLMRAQDTTPAALGMRRPAAQPSRRHPLAGLFASTAALRRVAAEYDHIADDVEILLATLAQLAPFADAVKAGASL